MLRLGIPDYRLPREVLQAEVELAVYDLAGNEVTRATVTGIAGADNEWVWDASGIAPGVYFCRVHAGGGNDRVEICKVAITP